MFGRVLGIVIASIAGAIVYLYGLGVGITRCMALDQAMNDACLAAYRASLPWSTWIWTTPVPAIIVFVLVTTGWVYARRLSD